MTQLINQFFYPLTVISVLLLIFTQSWDMYINKKRPYLTPQGVPKGCTPPGYARSSEQAEIEHKLWNTYKEQKSKFESKEVLYEKWINKLKISRLVAILLTAIFGILKTYFYF